MKRRDSDAASFCPDDPSAGVRICAGGEGNGERLKIRKARGEARGNAWNFTAIPTRRVMLSAAPLGVAAKHLSTARLVRGDAA
jgi:hypothetical protein